MIDPESQMLKTHDGWKQGYNGQVRVDFDSLVIVAQVTTDANDKQQLGPILEELEKVNDSAPSKVLANASYWSKANTELEDEQMELFMAMTKDWKRRKELGERGTPRGMIPDSAGPKGLMGRKLRTKTVRDNNWKRNQSVEPVFGQHVNHGLDRFILRGEEGAAAEWLLFSAMHNLLKLWRTQ